MKENQSISSIKLFILSFILCIGLFLALKAFWLEPSSLRITKNVFQAPENMALWRNKKIAVIADIHAGAPYINEDKLDTIVAHTNSQKPDIILLAGDYVVQNIPGGTFMPSHIIAGHLRSLKAPMGIYAVMGNHDNWENAPKISKDFFNAGIAVLEDEAVAIGHEGDTYWLVGLSDHTTGKRQYKDGLDMLPENTTAICLTHDPDAFPELDERCGLTIAGHMHGGQVNLPFIGAPIVPSIYGQRYLKGFIKEFGRTLYVSPGIGTSSLPVRFGAPPEISMIHIQ